MTTEIQDFEDDELFLGTPLEEFGSPKSLLDEITVDPGEANSGHYEELLGLAYEIADQHVQLRRILQVLVLTERIAWPHLKTAAKIVDSLS